MIRIKDDSFQHLRDDRPIILTFDPICPPGIERVFADAKEKHAMRYTHHRGLARVSAWVRLKYAAMNLKKLALWKWSRSDFFVFLPYFFFDTTKTPALA